MFFPYISPKPFKQMGKAWYASRPPPYAWREEPKWFPDGLFIMMNQKEILFLRSPKKKSLRSSVYLLISHHTFSSAGSFAWAFKEFGMGTVIGEESGGMNVSFGDIIYYKLPVSGLSCTISFKRFLAIWRGRKGDTWYIARLCSATGRCFG